MSKISGENHILNFACMRPWETEIILYNKRTEMFFPQKKLCTNVVNPGYIYRTGTEVKN